MAIIEINRNPAASDLKSFGRLLPVFATLAALAMWWRTGSGTGPAVIAGAAYGLTLVFFAVPRWRRPIYVGWLLGTYPLGWVVSHVVLALVFYGAVTPIGLLVRVLRGDGLNRRFDRRAATYWIDRTRRRDPESYLHEY